MRDRIFELTTPEEVNEFLEQFPNGALFKAGGCHKTMEGFGHVEKALGPRNELHMGFIRVIENRPASNHVAELTGVVHQSPQFILFVKGKAVYDVDNWDIQQEVVEGALNQHLGEAKAGAGASVSSDVTSYIRLLESFLGGKLPEDEFEAAWLETFQKDASPRGKDEFEMLNSLYGDVDAALSGGLVRLGTDKRSLKERAGELLVMLKKD